MNLKEARALRDEIRDGEGLHCTVPLGQPKDGYFARIWSCRNLFDQSGAGAVDFTSRDEWLAWLEMKHEYDRERERANRPKSPLDILIERACGL